MSKLRGVVIAVTAWLLMVGVIAAQVSAAENFEALMSGAQEVPPLDTRSFGRTVFQVSDDGTALNYTVIVGSIVDVTQAHIHLGERGTNGPVVAFLFGFNPDGVTVNGILAEGVITDESIFPVPGFEGTLEALLKRMRAGTTYVNVHTKARPAGEIRGQIIGIGP